jgi:hypothetical protein
MKRKMMLTRHVAITGVMRFIHPFKDENMKGVLKIDRFAFYCRNEPRGHMPSETSGLTGRVALQD